jgi:energy-coupling factor transport system substrate-specific component
LKKEKGGENMHQKLLIKDIVLASGLVGIIFVQEQFLTFFPNFQLTFLLMMVYSRTMGWKLTSIIVITHVLLDTMLYGGMMSIYTPFMIIAYLVIPITMGMLFKNIKSELTLATISIGYGLIYSWIFLIPVVLIMDFPLIPYLIADIPFEIMLVTSNFLTVLILFNPLVKVINFLKEEGGENNG